MRTLPVLNAEQIASLIESAAGPVSYQASMGAGDTCGVRNTALVTNGQWTSKVSASRFLSEQLDAERKAEREARIANRGPIVATGKRAEPYMGPFPRKRHSHKCLTCEYNNGQGAVACYKAQCTRAQVVAQCSWCKGELA